MSDENTHQPPGENRNICPKCGSPVEARETTPEPGIGICDLCSAPLKEPVLVSAESNASESLDSESPVSPPPQPQPGGRNPWALVVVALVAAVMLFIGFHMARRSGPTHPLGLAHNTVAPDFTLQSLDGSSMKLSDFRGKAVLLNFWATWCGPCRVEMPWFVELQKEYGPQGFQIVGVAMDESSKEDIAKFAQDMGVNYPVLLGKEAVGEEYGGVPALPESFFIGRDGKIVDKIIGLRGRGEIEESIRKALNTQAPTSAAASASGN